MKKPQWQINGNTITVQHNGSLLEYSNRSLVLIVEDADNQKRVFVSNAPAHTYKPGLLRNTSASIAHRQRFKPKRISQTIWQKIANWLSAKRSRENINEYGIDRRRYLCGVDQQRWEFPKPSRHVPARVKRKT